MLPPLPTAATPESSMLSRRRGVSAATRAFTAASSLSSTEMRAVFCASSATSASSSLFCRDSGPLGVVPASEDAEPCSMVGVPGPEPGPPALLCRALAASSCCPSAATAASRCFSRACTLASCWVSSVTWLRSRRDACKGVGQARAQHMGCMGNNRAGQALLPCTSKSLRTAVRKQRHCRMNSMIYTPALPAEAAAWQPWAGGSSADPSLAAFPLHLLQLHLCRLQSSILIFQQCDLVVGCVKLRSLALQVCGELQKEMRGQGGAQGRVADVAGGPLRAQGPSSALLHAFQGLPTFVHEYQGRFAGPGHAGTEISPTAFGPLTLS